MFNVKENMKMVFYEWKHGVKQSRETGESSQIQFYENGNKYKEFWFRDGYLYRENDLPHTILYNTESKVVYECWESDSPREGDKPSQIRYYENGAKKHESWYIDHVGFHRENNKPAEIQYYNSFDENGIQLVKSITWWCIDNTPYGNRDFPGRIDYDDEEGNEIE